MPISFESFVNALVGQESGGSYTVRNKRTGAAGRYQIMPGNIAAWSREILGYEVSLAQFLASPALQDKIAKGKLKKYVDQYGYRGAAAAWYSGNPARHNDTTKVQGGREPSVKQYVDSILSKAGGGSGTAENGPSYTEVPGVQTGENRDIDYGSLAALAAAIPDVANVLHQAQANGWDESQFEAAVRNTAWWRKTSITMRERQVQKMRDPATYWAERQSVDSRVKRLLQSTGMTLAGKDRDFIIDRAFFFNWDDDQITDYIGLHGAFSKNGQYGGQAGQLAAQFKKLLHDYGVPYQQKDVDHQVRLVMSGQQTEEGILATIVARAKAMNPQWADQLDSGSTVTELASPYMKLMAQKFGIDEASIDAYDPTIRKGISSQRQDGTLAPMDLWEFERSLTDDQRWDESKDAANAAFSFSAALGRAFGTFGG